MKTEKGSLRRFITCDEDISPKMLKDHTKEANNIYLKIRYLQNLGLSIDNDLEISNFTIWIISEDIDFPILNEYKSEIYVSVFDAFIDNWEIFSDEKYIYRGHSNSDWKLNPCSQRIQNSQAREFFKDIKDTFKSKVKNIIGQNFSDLAIEALCQHYGFYTDLLDLTETFEIAAYFGNIFENNSQLKIGVIFIFNKEQLIKKGKFVRWSEIPHLETHNQRLIRQKGCFFEIKSDNDMEFLLNNVKIIPFYIQKNSYLKLNQKMLTDDILFPPDEDDDISKLANEIIKANDKNKKLFLAFENSEFKDFIEDERILKTVDLEIRKQVQKNIDSIISWCIKKSNQSNSIEFSIFELLIWYDDPNILYGFLSSYFFQNRIFPVQWEEILILYLSLNISYITSWENYTESYTKLVELIIEKQTSAFYKILFPILENPNSEIFSLNFITHRIKIITLLQQKAEASFGLKDLEALIDWYWNERDKEIQTKIQGLLEELTKNKKFQQMRWSPTIPVLRRIYSEWSYPSKSMIWDLDISERIKRIIGAASDGNLYVFDFNGKRTCRFEVPCVFTKACFLNENLILVNGNQGSVYILNYNYSELKKETISILKEINFASIPTKDGCPTTFDINPTYQNILIGYGNAKESIGAIVLLNYEGKEIWKHTFGFFVNDVKLFKNDDNELCGVAIIVKNSDELNLEMEAHYLNFSKKSIQKICEAMVITLNCSENNQFFILGIIQKEGLSLKYRFEIYSSNNIYIDHKITNNLPIYVIYDSGIDLIIAFCVPLDTKQKGWYYLTAWKNGKILWNKEFSNLFKGILDVKRNILIFSSMGQGNLYAINLDGRLLSCAKTKNLSLCYKINKESDMLFIGSSNLYAFKLDKFLLNNKDSNN